MTPRFCYWSVVDGDYSLMMAAVIHSARRAGVDTDFHVWSDVPVPGSIHHPAGTFEKWGCLFKLEFLRGAVKQLGYDYFVWLDTDMWFVRDPGNVPRLLRGAPLHIALETDLTRVDMRRQEWWDCPNQRVVELMRQCGVLHPQVFNVNGGLFIVHRNAIDTVYRLAFEFSDFCKQQGFTFNDEPLLAYAMQRLCHDPNLHTLKATLDFWCSDWTGQFQDRLPDGQPWLFLDYFTEEPVLVNPAIVHAMRSKNALVSLGQELMTTVPQV
ncbi:MAG TPA: hypothetical protein VNU68_18600 [Verrucomicrobiae bacterium]|jgi:hypothetical protein|nr:hypothetical protein [Verrucomicrobiae bacterium]